MRLAQQVCLHDAVADRVRLPGDTGSNPAGKVATIVAGMLAGADSIDDLNIARHGGMPSLFTGVYAPATLGPVFRTFPFGPAPPVAGPPPRPPPGPARRGPPPRRAP